jgi:hypothetical protein
MPRKKNATSTERRGRSRSSKSTRGQAEPAAREQDELAAAAADKFTADLLARGEAVEAPGGSLPPGATHEVVGTDEQGAPIIRRRRFSAT